MTMKNQKKVILVREKFSLLNLSPLLREDVRRLMKHALV